MSSRQGCRNPSRSSAQSTSEQTWRDVSRHQPAMYFQHRVLLALAALAATVTSVVAAQDGSLPNSLTPAEVAQVVDRIRAPVVSEKVLLEAMSTGGVLLRAGRYSEAAKLLTAIAEKKPNDADVIYVQALA